jgi:undecaprenyl-diphosphatase
MGVAILLTAMIGLSRIYLGLHWTTDVLGGWCVGAAWALSWRALALGWERLRRSPRLQGVLRLGPRRLS